MQLERKQIKLGVAPIKLTNLINANSLLKYSIMLIEFISDVTESTLGTIWKYKFVDLLVGLLLQFPQRQPSCVELRLFRLDLNWANYLRDFSKLISNQPDLQTFLWTINQILCFYMIEENGRSASTKWGPVDPSFSKKLKIPCKVHYINPQN